MASDDKKMKTEPAPKNEAVAKGKSTSDAAPSKAEGKESKAEGKEPKSEGKESKPAGGEKAADASSGYSRGEGQKPVSKAYKDNWNAIFAKKKKR